MMSTKEEKNALTPQPTNTLYFAVKHLLNVWCSELFKILTLVQTVLFELSISCCLPILEHSSPW